MPHERWAESLDASDGAHEASRLPLGVPQSVAVARALAFVLPVSLVNSAFPLAAEAASRSGSSSSCSATHAMCSMTKGKS
jgi:hypothetical protein